MSDDILDIGESFQYQMCDGNNPVGMCYISIHDNKTSPRGEGQIYPDSWFIDENSDKLKPMLEIDGFGMYAGDNEGKGYGRFGLQMAYEKSVEHGCGGRIAVQATYSGPSFYEHCGFTGKDKGSEGLKLFNPTEENIATLYKKTRPESFNFQQDNYGIELNGQDFSLDEPVQEESQRGVSLEIDPETGKFVAVADYSQQRETSKKEYILHSDNKNAPAKKINLELGEEEYVDANLQKIRELRKRLKEESRDPLAAKQELLQRGLEEVGLSKNDLGKTGDSRTGEISDKHKKVANSQSEDAKWLMLNNAKQRK